MYGLIPIGSVNLSIIYARYVLYCNFFGSGVTPGTRLHYLGSGYAPSSSTCWSKLKSAFRKILFDSVPVSNVVYMATSSILMRCADSVGEHA